jgi:hypothetical protein
MENIILQLFERYRFRCVLLHPAQPDTCSGEELDIIISTDYALPPNLRLLPRAKARGNRQSSGLRDPSSRAMTLDPSGDFAGTRAAKRDACRVGEQGGDYLV